MGGGTCDVPAAPPVAACVSAAAPRPQPNSTPWQAVKHTRKGSERQWQAVHRLRKAVTGRSASRRSERLHAAPPPANPATQLRVRRAETGSLPVLWGLHHFLLLHQVTGSMHHQSSSGGTHDLCLDRVPRPLLLFTIDTLGARLVAQPAPLGRRWFAAAAASRHRRRPASPAAGRHAIQPAVSCHSFKELCRHQMRVRVRRRWRGRIGRQSLLVGADGGRRRSGARARPAGEAEGQAGGREVGRARRAAAAAADRRWPPARR